MKMLKIFERYTISKDKIDSICIKLSEWVRVQTFARNFVPDIRLSRETELIPGSVCPVFLSISNESAAKSDVSRFKAVFTIHQCLYQKYLVKNEVKRCGDQLKIYRKSLFCACSRLAAWYGMVRHGTRSCKKRDWPILVITRWSPLGQCSSSEKSRLSPFLSSWFW